MQHATCLACSVCYGGACHACSRSCHGQAASAAREKTSVVLFSRLLCSRCAEHTRLAALFAMGNAWTSRPCDLPGADVCCELRLGHVQQASSRCVSKSSSNCSSFRIYCMAFARCCAARAHMNATYTTYGFLPGCICNGGQILLCWRLQSCGR